MTLEDFYNSEWFKERPEKIQELFKKFPVNKEWFLKLEDKETYYGVRIIGWDEPKKGEPTARIINDGLLAIGHREVFGIEQEDLFSKEEAELHTIMYNTRPVLEIE